MKNFISRISISLAMIFSLSLAIVALAPRAEAGEPCCEITAINAKTGLVTAKEIATGVTFQFKANAKLLKSFKVGQAIGTGAIAKAGSLGGKPHCKCGKRADGTCWCTNQPGDLCYNPLCPSVPGVFEDKPTIQSK